MLMTHRANVSDLVTERIVELRHPVASTEVRERHADLPLPECPPRCLLGAVVELDGTPSHELLEIRPTLQSLDAVLPDVLGRADQDAVHLFLLSAGLGTGPLFRGPGGPPLT